MGRRPVIFWIASLWLVASAAAAQVFVEANGLRITEQGASGVDADTLFRRDAISSALPGLRIVASSMMSEGERVRVFVASDSRDPLLRIYGRDGRVAMIEGISAKVYGPDRIRIGMRFSQIRGQYITYCAPGSEEWSGAAFCGHEPGGALWFVFRNPDWAGPDGELPPAEVLAASRLVQIRWMALIPGDDAAPDGAESVSLENTG